MARHADGSLEAVLQQLLDEEFLDSPAARGIAKQVIARGRDSLSPEQERVFEEAVMDKFVTVYCSRCGCEIPYQEVMYAWGNEGRCPTCDHRWHKDD